MLEGPGSAPTEKWSDQVFVPSLCPSCFEIVVKVLVQLVRTVSVAAWVLSTMGFLCRAVEVGEGEAGEEPTSEAPRSGTLPPAAWHAAPPEPNTAHHFREAGFSR